MKNRPNRIVSVTLIILAMLANIWCLFGSKTNQFSYVLGHTINILALSFAFIYLLCGANKNASKWMKTFEVFLGLSCLSTILRYTLMSQMPAAIITMTVVFGLITALFFGKDFGKKKTYAFCGAIIALEVLAASITLFSKVVSVTRFIASGSRIAMVVVLLLLMAEKYYDKLTRGAY